MVLIIFKILFFGGFFLFIETIQLYLIPVHPVALWTEYWIPVF